jgi:hypothetical protein
MSAYDFIDASNPVRVIDVFVDALDLAEMSFEGVEPAATGRPSYHPSSVFLQGISFLRNFHVARSRRQVRGSPLSRAYPYREREILRMTTNCGASADSTLAHDVVGKDGVTVSGRQHPLSRIGPSLRVTVTRGCPGPRTNRTYDVSTSLSHEVVYERLKLETRFSHRCTDDHVTCTGNE